MKYNVIYVDIPWNYRDKANAGKRGANHKYPTLTLKEVINLPVNEIVADNCFLFLWATAPLLPDAFKVIEAWGFEYKTMAFVWVKKNKVADSLFWGMGNFTRSNAEFCLLAVKGKPKRICAAVHSVVMSPIQKHSQKPNEVRNRIVELCGNIPRLEIFAREKYDGWDCVGNEIDGLDIRDSLNKIICDNKV